MDSELDWITRLFQGKEVKYSAVAESPDLNPTDNACKLLETKLKAKSPMIKQEVKTAAVKRPGRASPGTKPKTWRCV